MKVNIYTFDKELDQRLRDDLNSGEQDFSERFGISVQCHGLELREVKDYPIIVNLSVSFLKEEIIDSAIEVFSDWLFDHINSEETKKLLIEHKEVRIDRENIKHVFVYLTQYTRSIRE